MSITISAMSPDTPAAVQRVRLDFLDGLRGLAALYVVLNHTCIKSSMFLGDEAGNSSHIAKVLHYVHYYLFNYGDYAVSFFIVLSGYCLMLPIVRSADSKLRGGIVEFIRRRAQRIYPPYLAALTLCLLLAGFGARLHINIHAMAWSGIAYPVFVSNDIISHLLLIQAWTPWIYRIDPPMWSVSVEWSIYFIFALLLLPIFRQFGIIVSVVFAILVGIVPHVLFHGQLDGVHLWMLGLFAMGMLGAAINFSDDVAAVFLNKKISWGVAAVVFGILLISMTYVDQRASLNLTGIFHWLRPGSINAPTLGSTAGLFAMSLIVYGAQKCSLYGSLPPLILFLESKMAVKLGTFSYSLYLIHDPIVELFWLWEKTEHIRPVDGAVLLYVVAVPIALAGAYLFHLAFERPFLPNHYKAVLQQYQ